MDDVRCAMFVVHLHSRVMVFDGLRCATRIGNFLSISLRLLSRSCPALEVGEDERSAACGVRDNTRRLV